MYYIIYKFGSIHNIARSTSTSPEMELLSWTAAAPAISAAFLASLVEVVEAFTIVVAVGTIQGWRPAILGSLAGLVLLAGLVVVLGPVLDRVPLHLLQLFIGVLLLLFGMRWLRTGSLRAAGIIPLHAEVAASRDDTTQPAE